MKAMNSEQVREFFNAHWTVRKYKKFQIPSEHLDIILEAAQRAPTDATAQLFSFIRLVSPDVRSKVAEWSGNPHIAEASEAFIVCADFYRLGRLFEMHSRELAKTPNIAIHFGIGDAVLAGQNLLIAAEMLGYRGCWIGGILNALEEISKLIELPERVFPFAGLTIGVPDEDPKHRPRLPRDQVIHQDKYVRQTPDQLEAGATIMGPITTRGDWVQTLSRYFASGGTMEDREKSLSAFLDKKFSRKEI